MSENQVNCLDFVVMGEFLEFFTEEIILTDYAFLEGGVKLL